MPCMLLFGLHLCSLQKLRLLLMTRLSGRFLRLCVMLVPSAPSCVTPGRTQMATCLVSVPLRCISLNGLFPWTPNGLMARMVWEMAANLTLARPDRFGVSTGTLNCLRVLFNGRLLCVAAAGACLGPLTLMAIRMLLLMAMW